MLNNALILQGLLKAGSSLPTNAANSLALLYLQYGFVNGSEISDGILNDSGKSDQTASTDTSIIAVLPRQGSELQFNFTPQRLEDIASTPEQLQGDLTQLVAALKKQLTAYDAEIDDLSQNTVAASRVETDPYMQSLFKGIADFQAQIETLQARKQELTQQRDLFWESYTLLTKGSEETTLSSAAADTLVRFAIPAPLPNRPLKSASPQSAILGAFTGLILALALVFGYELLDDKVRNRDDIEQVVELPVLALAPQDPAQHHQQVVALAYPEAPLADAMRMLRTTLTSLTDEQKSILITSRQQRDGRSTVAANLAVVTALSGRSVLLIDANLRSPHLHELFGVSNTTGLTDLLQNPAWDVGSIVQETGTPGLQLLPAGARNALAVDLLASERMGAILTEASGHADFIIIDSAALTPITDSLSLARAADVTLLVARVGTTRIMEVQRLRELVEGVGGNIHGVVLNRVPLPGGFLNPIVRILQARDA
ncbi:MAG: polysaccharide biosynthesis tyrosine autokinase [Chloroflexi bacterium]|nr:polysaccharide biosynthesis tyrosine autokinase [Chloroflexota bacterium]